MQDPTVLLVAHIPFVQSECSEVFIERLGSCLGFICNQVCKIKHVIDLKSQLHDIMVHVLLSRGFFVRYQLAYTQ